ncbi:FHA domain-containing protein [Myxococcota bacterium]|nr:FHA domain-containing protein [Myxococcota bacterium]MBU1431594.1 FHA domain-containing protein [Myxococcota bacterium]MBU1900393.1 FHA domain-containing protein [Myxococcota bacterium]
MSAQRGEGWVDLQTHDPSDSLSGACRANLYVYQPSGRIDWFALNLQRFLLHARFIFGREPSCDITLNDPAVSGQHAQLILRDDRLVLEDLDSKNGVKVNGEPCQSRRLRHGDVITFGGTDVRFLYGYPKTPRHLTLTFEEGALKGRKIATMGTSTTLGRAHHRFTEGAGRTLRYGEETETLLNLVGLPGEEIGRKQARLDVYGPRLIYLFNLNPKHGVWLNGVRVEGITAAREGDALRVGEHALRLSLLNAQDVAEATLQPDGTLLLAEAEEEALPDGAMRLEPLVAPSEAPAPIDPPNQDSDELDFSSAFRSFVHASSDETWADGEGLANTDELALIDAEQARQRSASGALSMISARRRVAARAAAAGLSALLLLALLWPTASRHPLRGQLEAARHAALLVPKPGRLSARLAAPGARVVEGEILFHVSDAVIDAQIKALDLEIHTRQARLTQGEALSPEALVIERAAIDDLAERLNGLRARRLYPIKAPISGVLSGDLPSVGARLSAEASLGEIIDARRLIARVAVPSRLLSHPARLKRGALQIEGTHHEIPLALAQISEVPDKAGAFFIATPLGDCAARAEGGSRCEGVAGVLESPTPLRLGQEIIIWIEQPSISGARRLLQVIFD